jgi:hypothetical protein
MVFTSMGCSIYLNLELVEQILELGGMPAYRARRPPGLSPRSIETMESLDGVFGYPKKYRGGCHG